LVILHLSDLHFGPHSRFGRMRPQAIADMFGHAIERQRIEAGLGRIDLVVVSGDLTEYADDEQFDAARSFCQALNGHFGLGRERWAFVPGNHDLSWAYIELARVEQKIQKFDDEELERRIREYKFRNYAEFLARFYASFEDDLRRVALASAGWVQDIPALRVSLGLINSSESTTDRAKAGKLGTEQAQALLDHWRSRDDDALRILVVHHNPQELDESSRREAIGRLQAQANERSLNADALDHFISDTFGLEGKDLLERVAKQARVPLLLHGHVHATPRRTWEWDDGEGHTHVLATGSAGASASQSPSDQPNSVQLIALDLDDGRAQVLRLRYEPRAEEPGRVETGTFVREASELGGLRALRFSLPPGLLAQRERPQPVESSDDDSGRGFLKEYRARLSGRFETWGLGTRQRGTRQPAVVTLDDMYVPLRIDAGYDQETFETGSPLDVDQLLARTRGLIVRGGPGAGKTTWLRWLFRRMVEREDVLPIFLELRALAHRWSKLAPSEPHNLESYLSVWLAEWVGAGWEQPFRAARSQASPRPVLLIDGWDELGDLGRELGPQLVSIAQTKPHVLIIATSRPYGEGVSELKVRFDELQLQPMSDAEVASFVRNFYERVHRSEPESVTEHVERFLANLAINPQARHLGRTPLLLVLLLIIGRDRPLPDRRHELYRMCIEDLLDARPKQRQALGAMQGSWEWAPEHYEERLQAVAKLACSVQSRHLETQQHERARDALATREQLCAELGHWDPHRRDEFLTWLVSGAGLLLEREDGKLQFAHLGLQEYLAAWHLDATHEGRDARLESMAKYADKVEWWEVLRLWMALIEGKSAENLRSVLAGLTTHSAASFWLVGAVLADGLGAGEFEPWLVALCGRLDERELVFQTSAASAWKLCQQHARRERIAERLAADVPGWTLMHRFRADMWRGIAGIEGALPLPSDETPAGWIMGAHGGPLVSERHLAWMRVWMSTSPFWGSGIEMLGLRLWPTRRSLLGWAIQSALGFGMRREQVFHTPWHRLLRESAGGRSLTRSLASALGRSLAMDFGKDFGMDMARDLAMSLAMVLALDLSKDLPRDLARDIAMYNAMEVARPLTSSMATQAVLGDMSQSIHHARAMARGMLTTTSLTKLNGGSVASSLALDPTDPVTQDLATWLTFSAGFAGTRTVFAHSKDTDPLIDLLRTACRHSLDPARGILPASTFSGDPLWPALARHVARSSTPEDRVLLEAHARDPDQASEPLRWSLRYIVRGDVMFEDGSVVDLDEIWASLRERFAEEAAQLQDLPLLDEMRPNIEMDRSAIEHELAELAARAGRGVRVRG
jgi:calcineurin-like phosphoesterase family protein